MGCCVVDSSLTGHTHHNAILIPEVLKCCTSRSAHLPCPILGRLWTPSPVFRALPSMRLTAASAGITLTSSMHRTPFPVSGLYCPAGASLFWKNHWKRVSFLVLVVWGRQRMRRLHQAFPLSKRKLSSSEIFHKPMFLLHHPHALGPHLLFHPMCYLGWLPGSGLLLIVCPWPLEPCSSLSAQLDATSSRKSSWRYPRMTSTYPSQSRVS